MHIRPICLIQVERTGRDQRLPGVVHAEDAREYLMEHPDIGAEQIAVKTSTRDDLKEVDDAGGLLARDCQIRFIITKQALQEGWDCAFAYVLAILTRPSSTSALTQLVGRILRQPYARKTGDRWLDESYVFCFQRQSVELLREVRRGFSREGLGDPLYDLPLGERPGDDIEMQVGVDGGLAAASTYAAPDRAGSGGRLDHAFAASHLLDVMPNPWRGSEVARRVFGALLERHARALVVSNYGFILEELHKRLEIERDRLPRDVFTGLLETGEMRFIVAAEELGFNRLPRQIKTAPDRQANREDGSQYLLNLFDRTDENELNALENRVATFLSPELDRLR